MKHTAAAAFVLLLLLGGCGAKKKIDPVPTEPVTEETITALTEATAARPVAERVAELKSDGDTYLFDEQNVLSDEERQQYNDYLGYLSRSRLLCASAVITDSLGGVSPEQFAENYFQTLFGDDAAGFLFLINNDTNQDYFYCTDACNSLQTDAQAAIAAATPALVEGRYAEALEILLPVGETLSDRVFDYGGLLTDEQAQSLQTLAQSQEKRSCVLFLRNLPGEEPAAPPMPETLPPEMTDDSETLPDSPETEPEPSETAAPPSDALIAYAGSMRDKTEADSLLVI
nr:TPM domain-containing protein [Oscillospiraceae bacterium]